MLLTDKTAVISGAASPRGIGLATARLFAEHGARVAILDLDAAAAKGAAEELGTAHRNWLRRRRPDQMRQAAEQVIAAFGQIDILINNAGITQPVKFLDIKPERLGARIDVNLKGILYLSQAVIPHMQKRKAGSIACMSSVSAQRGGGIFGGPHYSAAKAGVLGLAKAMAREFGPDGIRVNCVTPGLIGTDITAGKLTDEMRAKILEGIPLGTARRGEGRRGNLHVPRLGPVGLRHRRRDRRQRRDAHSLRRSEGEKAWIPRRRLPTRPTLAQRARNIRRNALRMGEVQGQGYIAQALDIADVLAVAYFHAMRYRPEDPSWEDRDRFLLSNGHYAIALYAALIEAGIVPEAELETYGFDESRLPMSGMASYTPGMEMSGGSLGARTEHRRRHGPRV